MIEVRAEITLLIDEQDIQDCNGDLSQAVQDDIGFTGAKVVSAELV
jgi:hypothetical protein